ITRKGPTRGQAPPSRRLRRVPPRGCRRRGSIGLPDVADGVAFGERVVGVDHVAREASDPSLAAQGRYHGRIRTHGRLGDQAPGEDGAEDTLVAKVRVETELASRVEGGHARARAGAAR